MSQINVDRVVDASGGVLAPISSVMRNRIINGAMVIDQRNAGASVTPTASGYTLDRWRAGLSVSSKFSVQQNAGSVTPPVGFKNYIGATSLSAYTVGAGEVFNIAQFIEGFNAADLDFGTANAKTITLSFWVYSSLTGTFGGALSNDARNRSYPFSYTISVANTWEYKTITIAGDTSGTWLTSNNVGIRLEISIGAGATLSGTAGAWAGADYRSATGATSVVGTNGATFYITGVQFEVGTQATSFEYRQYGTEFQLCQRYFQAYIADVPYARFASGWCAATTTSRYVYSFPVKMRTPPTGSLSGSFAVYSGADAVTASTSVTLGDFGSSSVAIAANTASGLILGQGALLIANDSAAARFNFSAEL
jgi:hypothetical protein